MASTLAALRDRVHSLVGLALAEVGLLFRAVGEGGVPITPAIDEGIQVGIAEVGIPLLDGLEVTDADVANLSPFGIRRVVLHAQIEALERVLQDWHRAVKRHHGEAMEPQPIQGGWLVEERKGVVLRLDRLRARVAEPYREPSDPVVIANPARTYPRHTSDAVRPADSCYDPCGFPEGGWW